MTKAEEISDDEIGADCGIPNSCSRTVPTWLVLLDNIPTMTMFVLGGILVWLIWWPLSIFFLVYCAASIVLFWALICPYCHHYNTRACPCGYGVLAPKMFKSKLGATDRTFREVFRKNISIMFPCWLVPFVAGIYLLVTSYSTLVLTLLVLFCIVGFVIIPSISKFVGCRDCEIKKDCPWIGIMEKSVA